MQYLLNLIIKESRVAEREDEVLVMTGGESGGLLGKFPFANVKAM